jgi:hypothetical protein
MPISEYVKQLRARVGSSIPPVSWEPPTEAT